MRDPYRQAEAICRTGHWQYDHRTRKVAWSDGFRAAFGLGRASRPSLEAVIGQVHAGDRPAVASTISDALERHEGWEIVHRTRRPEGDIGFAPLETLVAPGGRFQVEIVEERAVAVIDGAHRRPIDEELFAPYPFTFAFAGRGALLVGGRTPSWLDLATGRKTRLLGAKGLELGALSPSGDQVLAVTGERYVWHARRGTTSADVSRRRIRS